MTPAGTSTPRSRWARRTASQSRRSARTFSSGDQIRTSSAEAYRAASTFGIMALFSRSPLQNRGDPLAAGGADGDQAATGTPLGEQLRQRRGDPAAGGRERVPDGERRADDV